MRGFRPTGRTDADASAWAKPPPSGPAGSSRALAIPALALPRAGFSTAWPGWICNRIFTAGKAIILSEALAISSVSPATRQPEVRLAEAVFPVSRKHFVNLSRHSRNDDKPHFGGKIL